jgi:hypothetical protein
MYVLAGGGKAGMGVKSHKVITVHAGLLALLAISGRSSPRPPSPYEIESDAYRAGTPCRGTWST